MLAILCVLLLCPDLCCAHFRSCYEFKLSLCISYSLTDLIQATQESNVNVPQMADTLFERAGNASWIVVFKALVTTHHLMVHGNEVRSKHLITALLTTCIVERS